MDDPDRGIRAGRPADAPVFLHGQRFFRTKKSAAAAADSVVCLLNYKSCQSFLKRDSRPFFFFTGAWIDPPRMLLIPVM